MTFCVECGKPWGILLERGEEPTDERLALARDELVELFTEYAECDLMTRNEVIDPDKLPKVVATQVVWLTEAMCEFIYERLNIDEVLAECWQEIRWTSLPAWYLKDRKVRWAYMWEDGCCNMGWAQNYVKEVTPNEPVA